MRQLSRILLLLIIVSFTHISARASHIYGLDFYYEHVSGYTYRIYLVVYGDCAAAIYGNLSGATPRVQVRNGNNTVANIPLSLVSGPVEVTPVCSRLKDSTKCVDTNYAIPGVGQFIYTSTYTLSGMSANWLFYFGGEFTNHAAGRAYNISNINPGSIVAMEAALNNTSGPNSSPTFTTLPTPFYCINVPQQYNQGAVDKDGDSLSYALVPALASNSGAMVTYIAPATPTNPLTTATGSFSFSSTTGQLNFTPSAVQRSLVVQQVTEYRNGVVVGTASREMTFIVLNNCNNTPSNNAVDTNKANLHAVAVFNANTVNICYGTNTSQFQIKAINPGADTIDASVSGLPTGATATITQNKTPNPIIQINWNLPTLAPGNYNFFVTYRDNGCPLSSVQTQAYTVAVVIPFSIYSTILAPTQCIHKAFVGFNISNGVLPRYMTVKQNGTTIRQYTSNNSGSFADSFAVGIYNLMVSSPFLPCSTSYTFRVVDSGVYPNIPKADTSFYCLFDPSTALVAIPDSGATLNWFTVEGERLPEAPVPRTDTAGVFYWLVGQHFKVCNSLTDTIRAYVTKRPTAEFIFPPAICIDDTANILFSGSIGVGPIIEYEWNWGDGHVKSGQDAGPWQIYWHTAGVKVIKLIAVENKCRSFETEHTLIVQPNPYAGFNVGDAVCEYDTLRVTYNSRPYEGQTYNWSFQDADTPTATDPGPYLLRWHNSGTKVISLTVELSGCTDTRTAEVIIHPVPDARILNAPGPVCIGDKIFLKADGGERYVWAPADSVFTNENGELYAQILKPSIFSVYVTSDFGCVDSAAIAYNDIEPCCQFSYPNAFTPNGDGRNDRFHIVTYGNQLRYELSIYNNWGQRVYYGLDPHEGWDGNFKGKPCEPGTYFYYLNATCYTGRQETHKGDLVLVR
jgi:gliding motility-associated-like protein